MYYSSKKNNQIYCDSSSISDKNSKKSNQKILSNKVISDKNLNSFKGIINKTRIKSLNEKNVPILKYDISDKKRISSNYIPNIYNNEEHLNKNSLFQLNSEKKLPKINETSSKKLSKRWSRFKLSNNLFKINNNFSSAILKKEKRISIINHKRGDMAHKHSSKFHNDFSFFFKLKEKNKIPSKTPYLDRKAGYSSYNLNKFKFDENTTDIKNTVNNTDKISNKDFLDKIESKSLDDKVNRQDKNNNMIKIDKKSVYIKGKEKENLNNIKVYNNDIKNIEKKDNTKLDINNNSHNKQIFIHETKNEIKNKNSNNNIIITILSKPFFCCLKT